MTPPSPTLACGSARNTHPSARTQCARTTCAPLLMGEGIGVRGMLIALALLCAGCTISLTGDGLTVTSPQAEAAATAQVIQAHSAATATAVAIEAIATREAAVTLAQAAQAQAELANALWWARIALWGVGLPLLAWLAFVVGRGAWDVRAAAAKGALLRASALYPNPRGSWPVLISGQAVHNLDTAEVYALNAPKPAEGQQVAIGGAVRLQGTQQNAIVQYKECQ